MAEISLLLTRIPQMDARFTRRSVDARFFTRRSVIYSIIQ